MLVDYDDSEEDQQVEAQKTQHPAPVEKKIKKIQINELISMSKKVKGDLKETSIVNKEDDDDWVPGQQSNTVEEIQKQQGKYQMSLPQPKHKDAPQPFKNNNYQRNRRVAQPPGLSFDAAEAMTKNLLENKSEDAQKYVEDFDEDDEFIRDIKKLQQEQTLLYVDVQGEELDPLRDLNELSKGQQNIKMLEIRGEDLQNQNWRAEQEKKRQAQEKYMKIPELQPSSRQKEKNHISSLLYQAALKEEEFDERKQHQITSMQNIRKKYGW